MIVLQFVEVYAMYPRIVISSPLGNYRTSMLPCPLKHKHTSLGAQTGDHYMSLQRSTPGRTSDFTRVFVVL
jgi:hypothetical protein